MKRQAIITGTIILISAITILLADEVFMFCMNELGKTPEKAMVLAVVLSLACPVLAVVPMRWELVRVVMLTGIIACQIYASTASIVAPKMRATLSPADQETIGILKKQMSEWPDDGTYRTRRTEISMQIAKIQERKTAEPLRETLPVQIVAVRLFLEILLILLASALKLYLDEPVNGLDTPALRVANKDLTSKESSKALTYNEPTLSQEAKSLYHWLGWKGGEATKTQINQSKAFPKGDDLESLLAELTSAGIVKNGDGKTYKIAGETAPAGR